MPPSVFYIAFFILGSTVGSFLNVVTLRYRPEGRLFDFRDIGGRSHCPGCARTLTPVELIPIASFVVQRGKCRTCSARLTFQYPLVEFACALVFVAVPLFLNRFYGVPDVVFFSFGAAWWYYILVVLWILVFLSWIVLTIIDLRHYIIPNGLNLSIGILGVAISAIVLVFHSHLPALHDSFLGNYGILFSPFDSVLANRAVGVLAGGAFFGLFSFFSRGRAMGQGDVKLAFASGFVLGWPDIGLAIALSFIIGGLVGGFTLATKRKGMKDRLPFGPFFVLGAALTFFFGFPIIQWYFSIFRLV